MAHVDKELPALAVRDLALVARRDGKRVQLLDGVSFEIDHGDTVALVGESGCGKSITSLSILRLLGEGLELSKGSIELGTSPRLRLDELSEKEMRAVRGKHIGMIFQDPMTSLNPLETVASQLIEAIRVHRPMTYRDAWNESVQLLAGVGISDPEIRMRAYPHELSGGLRQRVMIAMALSCSPTLLIADEPTTALDVTIQAQILRLLRDLQTKLGMSMLFVTHDLGVVAQIAARIVVMYAGQIVEYGRARDVLRSPKHPYTQGLMRAIPRADIENGRRRLDAIPGLVPSPEAMPAGCRFAPRCAHADARICSAPPRWTA